MVILRRITLHDAETDAIEGTVSWDGRAVTVTIGGNLHPSTVRAAALDGEVLLPRDGEPFLDAILLAFRRSSSLVARETMGPRVPAI